MIEFFYETDFELENETNYSDWISRIVVSENRRADGVSFIFCDDDYLLEINQKYLYHDTLTDIITFDYCDNALVNGDVFISVVRVRENAYKFKIGFEEELLRVMSHGVLHLLGYNDKTEEEIGLMRSKEEEKIKMFHVEH